MLEFDRAPNGIVGLETAIPLALDRLVHRGVVTLRRLVELLATNPARIFKLDRGILEVGAAADVTVIDPGRVVKVDASQFQSRSRNTPFDGWELKGAAAATVVGGRLVWPPPLKEHG
jgi:dihydroorotase